MEIRGTSKSTLTESDETIYLPEYGTKITNHNTRITNNIKITNSNDQNITVNYGMFCVILSVLNFEFRSLVIALRPGSGW